MDIKDFILIGGGLLIAAVVAHGFWIAWRARRDPLRLDLVKDFPAADDADDLDRLRAELPNGGARVRSADGPEQTSLALTAEASGHAPMLLETSDPVPAESGRPRSARTEPRLDARSAVDAGAGDHAESPVDAASADPSSAQQPAAREPTPGEPAAADADSGRPARGRVTDVIMPERPIRADEPKQPRRWSARREAAEEQAGAGSVEAPGGEPEVPESDRASGQPERRPDAASRATTRGRARSGRGAGSRDAQAREASERGGTPVDELVMVNVLAPKGQPFVGGGLVEALRARGLRYGEMNIFHRIDPMTKSTLYSVVNVVEPGTFDMSDLDGFRSPGVCFFMQLPGPEQPMEAFEDMLNVARDVSLRTGGSLLDENRSVMTGQTVEHYRQRITDYCRRRMSMRA